MNADGFNSSTFFQDGLITDLIEDESKISAIELDATTINFDSFDLKHNGVLIPTGSSAVSNPMIADLDAATYNIVNVNQLTTDSIGSSDLTRFIDFNSPAQINITTTDLKLNSLDVLTTPLQSNVDCNLKILSNCNRLNVSSIQPLTTNDMEIQISPLYISMQSNIIGGNISCVAGTSSGTLQMTGYNINLTGTVLKYNSRISQVVDIHSGNNTYSGLNSEVGTTNNTSYGSSAGSSTSGTNNTAIGYNTMPSATITAKDNTAIGSGALSTVSTGIRNTACGVSSLLNLTTGEYNTAIGRDSGSGITIGTDNISIGSNVNNTVNSANCNRCIVIGNTSTTNTNLSNSIVIGYGIASTVSNEIVIGTSAATIMRSNGSGVCDLGTPANKYKDLYLSGNINGLTTIGGVWMQLTSATAIAATTTETNLIAGITNLGSLTVAANTFTQSAYQLILYGNFGSANGNTITVRFKFGAVVFSIIPTLTGTSSEHFELEIDYTIAAIGGLGVASITQNSEFSYSDTGSSSFLGDRSVSTNNTNFDTTISNTLQITAQFSTNSVSNTIQCLRGVLRKLY